MSLLHAGRMMGVVAGLALVLSSVPAWAQTGGLEGKCTGQNGEPLVGYLVQIERTDIKGNYKTKTGKKGDYMHIGLPSGDYKVTLQNPGGNTVYFFQTRVNSGEPTKLDFDLAKEAKLAAEAQEKQIEADPELKRKQEQQAKDAKQLTSLKELYEQGVALTDQGQYAEAVAIFEQALPLAKTNNIPVILGRLAEASYKAKMHEKAVDAYQKAIAISPATANLHNNLGNVYADMGKTAEAAAEFQKAAELDPAKAASYFFNFGAVMYNVGKMDEAIAAFQKAIAANPAYAEAQFMLGRTLMGKLDMDPDTGKMIPAPGTVEALEAYLELEPQGKHAAEAQTMLDTVQSSVETTYKRGKKKSKS